MNPFVEAIGTVFFYGLAVFMAVATICTVIGMMRLLDRNTKPKKKEDDDDKLTIKITWESDEGSESRR